MPAVEATVITPPRDDGLAIEAHHFSLPVRVEVGEVAAHAEAGVVDEQVHVYAELLNLARQLRGLGGEVAVDHVSGGGHLLGELLEPVLAAGHEDQVVAACRELPGELLPDAGGRSGDQCRLSHGTNPKSNLSRPRHRGRAGPGANIGA